MSNFDLFTVTIQTDNAAFNDGYNGAVEVARILEQIAGKLHDSMLDGTAAERGICRDSNGNQVGAWKFQQIGEV